MHKSWLKGIASAPLAAALGALSIALTAVVVLGVGSGGRLSTMSVLGLGGATILAVLATAQASRPSKPAATRPRRVVTRPAVARRVVAQPVVADSAPVDPSASHAPAESGS